MGSAAAIADIVAEKGQSIVSSDVTAGETATTTRAAVADTHTSSALFDPTEALTLVSATHHGEYTPNPAHLHTPTSKHSHVQTESAGGDNTHVAFTVTNGLHGETMAVAALDVDTVCTPAHTLYACVTLVLSAKWEFWSDVMGAECFNRGSIPVSISKTIWVW